MTSKAEILSEVEALAVHCRPPLMSVEQRESWLRDWCHDLSEFPLEAIRTACRKWRQSGSSKFPTPGQLMPLIREAMPTERRVGDNQPWRPLSDEEYSGLTLEGKIRHHRILAAEARRKAGPMFRSAGNMKGEHITADQMPPIWREWTKRAENHEAESKRLWELLRRSVTASEQRA